MNVEYDAQADAVFITLRPGVPFAFSVHLDDDRHIDFGPDEKPMRIELLGVSRGVDLTDLPQRAAIARALADAHLPGWDEAEDADADADEDGGEAPR
jgi:uncharacterized protein YuzE